LNLGRASRDRLPNGEQLSNAYKRAATGEIAAKIFRATGLFPCDKNIFRPHDFSLASENTEAAPMNHSALGKTSYQPSFSSFNFSPFSSAEAPHASDISVVPSLNLKPNPRGGTVKKIISSSYRNFDVATQKKKIKQATKPKSNQLGSNTLLGPSKRRKRLVCRDPTASDTPSDSDTHLTLPFANDSTEEEEQDADCVFCTGRFSEDHNVEEWIRFAKYFRWAHILCVCMEEDFVCEPC
jgi:hypothetical protein